MGNQWRNRTACKAERIFSQHKNTCSFQRHNDYWPFEGLQYGASGKAVGGKWLVLFRPDKRPFCFWTGLDVLSWFCGTRHYSNRISHSGYTCWSRCKTYSGNGGRIEALLWKLYHWPRWEKEIIWGVSGFVPEAAGRSGRYSRSLCMPAGLNCNRQRPDSCFWYICTDGYAIAAYRPASPYNRRLWQENRIFWYGTGAGAECLYTAT